MASVNPADISLRPAVDADEAFLRRVHDAARHWEFEPVLASGQEDVYHTVMAQQFASQRRGYEAIFPHAQFGVIMWTDRMIGKLTLNYAENEVRVVDIAVLPEYRGHGIGEIVLRGICIEAGMRRVPVRLHAHSLGRAKDLYFSLGFQQIGTDGPNLHLEWRHPDPGALMRGQFNPRSFAAAVPA